MTKQTRTVLLRTMHKQDKHKLESSHCQQQNVLYTTIQTLVQMDNSNSLAKDLMILSIWMIHLLTNETY